jgi:hypothetical protein
MGRHPYGGASVMTKRLGEVPEVCQKRTCGANYSGLATMSGRSESQQLAIASICCR